MIRHDIADTLVLKTRDVVSPLDHGFEKTELHFRLEGPVASNHHVVVEVFDKWFLIEFEA
jgi:hypothetical protein